MTISRHFTPIILLLDSLISVFVNLVTDCVVFGMFNRQSIYLFRRENVRQGYSKRREGTGSSP